MLKYKKMIFIMLLPIILFPVVRYYFVGSSTSILLERYVTIDEFFTIAFIGYETIAVIFFYINKKIVLLWYEKIFHYTMTISILLFIIAGLASKGASVNTILWIDHNDTLMDFFNSIQYGLYPYSNYVIYPPLINVLYACIGRFVVFDPSMSTLQYRDTQMGMLCFGLYLLSAYGVFIYSVNKFQTNLRDKILIPFCLLLSTPFLYLFDRANSIILVLPCILIYIYYYESKEIKYKIFSYICLSIAVGIKISPILFSALIIRNKDYKGFVIFSFICSIIFIVPFAITDGDIFILLDNIMKTSSMFNGLVMHDGELKTVGHGFNMNISSTVSIITRIFDVNLLPLAKLFSMILLLSTAIFSLVKLDIPAWKNVALLSLILVLCPGFSWTYNVVYMSIPLILFLASKPENSRLNIVYLILYLLMFIPIVNIRMNIFNVFINDAYPVQLMQILESIGLICMAIILIIDFVLSIYDKYLSNNPHIMWKCVLMSIILITFSLYESFSLQPIDAFYPKNVSSPSAIKELVLSNGAYSGIDNKADFCIKTEKLKQYGLIVNCYNESRDMKDFLGEKLAISINGEYVNEFCIDNKLGSFGYIAPNFFDVINDEYIWLSIVRNEKISSDKLPLAYAGPAYPGDDIYVQKNMFNVSSGVYDNWMSKSNKFIFSYEMLSKGIYIDYYVPQELLTSNKGNVSMTISIDGEIIEKNNITEGNMRDSVIIDKTMISDELLNRISSDRSCIIDITFSDIINWPELNSSSENRDKTVKLIYADEIPRYDTIINENAPNLRKIYIDRSQISEKGVDLIFSINSSIFNSNDQFIHICVDGVKYKTIKLDKLKYNYISRINISQDMFKRKEGYSEIQYYINDDSNIINNSSREFEYLSKNIQLRYFGEKIDLFNSLSLKDNNMSIIRIGRKEVKCHNSDFELISNGFIYDKEMQAWFMGYNAGVMLPLSDISDMGVTFDCIVEPYMFMKNSNSKLIDVYINDYKCKTIKINSAGELFILITPDDLARFKDKEYVYVNFVASDIYNQRKLYITKIREKNNDRSIGIKNIQRGKVDD